MTDRPPLLRTTPVSDGTLLRITIENGKGNILDTAVCEALAATVAGLEGSPEVRSLLIEGAGRHFSFGASVEEHRADRVAGMLRIFHDLFRRLASSRRVLLAAVRGQCLGGGLELAMFCHRVFAAPDAKLGNPEIRLGVFAPLASAVLPLRTGQAAADDILLTGRTLEASEALAAGLIDAVAEDPAAAALAWHETHLKPLSASSLRHAVAAGRDDFHARVFGTLDRLERSYIGELMSTHDAVEGIEAFLGKRAPQWKNA